jgi:hypothetical protein
MLEVEAALSKRMRFQRRRKQLVTTQCHEADVKGRGRCLTL